MQKSITLVHADATDDSCRMQFHAIGHHPVLPVLYTLIERVEREQRDIPLWVMEQAPVRHCYSRTVKSRLGENSLGHFEIRYADTPRKGYKPVTLIDFWFPSKVFKAIPPTTSDAEPELAMKVMIVGREQGGKTWDQINVHLGDLLLNCDVVNDRTVRLAAKLAASHGCFFKVFDNCSDRVISAAKEATGARS